MQGRAAAVGLRKVRDLDDMIGHGTAIEPIERPYLKLADDPRVLAYSDLDAASFTQLELKLAAARRFRDEVRHTAMRNNVPVGQTMAASGLGGGALAPEGDVVGDHDAGIRRSMAMDEAARMQTLATALARIGDIHQQAVAAINHPHSKSAVERARQIGYGAASLPVGALTGSELLADIAGRFAANSAEDATVLASQIGTMVSDARASAARHQEELIRHEIPPHFLGRQEA